MRRKEVPVVPLQGSVASSWPCGPGSGGSEMLRLNSRIPFPKDAPSGAGWFDPQRRRRIICEAGCPEARCYEACCPKITAFPPGSRTPISSAP